MTLGSLLLLIAGCGGGSSLPSASGRACLARLTAHDISYRAAEPEGTGGSCQVDAPLRVSRAGSSLSPPATMSCALASRLDDFEREVVQPLALEELGERVVRIDDMGSFSCRGIKGNSSHLSQHALGQAIDIAGFRLSDGSTVSIEKDWTEPGPKRLFLQHLASRACQYFSVVLTPDSNADHYNHIHLDIGPEHLCSM